MSNQASMLSKKQLGLDGKVNQCALLRADGVITAKILDQVGTPFLERIP